MVFALCGVVCSQLTHLSLEDWEDICKWSYYHRKIGSISPSHCCHIFPWLCVWSYCSIIFSQLLHIDPASWVFVSITTMQFKMCAHNWMHYNLNVVFVCLHITSHYHHYADVSESSEHIRFLSGILWLVSVYNWVHSRNCMLCNIWAMCL